MSIINDDSGKPFDGKTMIAIVMMVVVITVGMALQNYFFPKPVPAAQQQATPAAATAQAAAQPGVVAGAAPQSTLALADAADAPLAELKQVVSTDLFEATFSNKGGELV